MKIFKYKILTLGLLLSLQSFAMENSFPFDPIEVDMKFGIRYKNDFYEEKDRHSIISSASFSPYGKWLLITFYDEARILDALTGKLVSQFSCGHNCKAAFGPSGTKIITWSSDPLSNVVKLWEFNSEKDKWNARVQFEEISVRAASFSPDGSNILTTSWRGPAKLWDVASGKLLYILGNPDVEVNSASFSFDGRKVITACDDETAKIWDVSSCRLVSTLEGHGGPVYYAAFSRDGKNIVTRDFVNRVKVFNEGSGQLLYELYGQHVDISSDSSKILTSGGERSIWDLAAGELLFSLKDSSQNLMSISFSPDCTKIVTRYLESDRYKVWSGITGELLYDVPSQTGSILGSAFFNPDSTRIFTVAKDNTCKIWVLPPNSSSLRWYALKSMIRNYRDRLQPFISPELRQKLLFSPLSWIAFKKITNIDDVIMANLLNDDDGINNYVRALFSDLPNGELKDK